MNTENIGKLERRVKKKQACQHPKKSVPVLFVLDTIIINKKIEEKRGPRKTTHSSMIINKIPTLPFVKELQVIYDRIFVYEVTIYQSSSQMQLCVCRQRITKKKFKYIK